MINYNGQLLANTTQIDLSNRGFKFGDALFETIKIKEESVVFCEDHYFRLMASMRLLRMEIPMHFTLEYFESEILKTINANTGNENRVRFTVFRNSTGLYCPESNDVAYFIECSLVDDNAKTTYEVELFKDFTVNKSLLSTIKTNNKVLNVVASIYARENGLDNCILINEDKNVVEFTNGNLFIVVGNEIKTPPLTDGCVNGIARKKIISLLKNHKDYTIIETSISPFELQKASEVFMTNAIVGIQPIYKYKKKQYATSTTLVVKELFSSLN